jgi:uncharacterized membrane protein
MAPVEKSVEVEVPVTVAYNQWTQFEEFPKFMEGVEEVQQIDDTHLRWRAEIGGQQREWEAEITEQIPDQKIAWQSTSGKRNAGVVTFAPAGDNRTRVSLSMDVETEGVIEKAGEKMGVIDTQVEEDLGRFKNLIESMGVETGAWRGTV